MEKLKRVEVGLIYFLILSFLDFESFKMQLDDEYIVVEQEGLNDFENKLKLKEVEMRKVIVYVKRLEDMYNIVEWKILIFERQVNNLIFCFSFKIEEFLCYWLIF